MSEDMDSLLECAICISEFTDPRTLPCLHTYCLSCLKSHIGATASGDRFKCPACRKSCQVPRQVEDFPKNFFVNTMISSRAEKKRKGKKKVGQRGSQGSSPRRTKMCEHANPVARCEDCGEFLCRECSRRHRQSKDTRHHRLTPIEGLVTADSSDDGDDDDDEADQPMCETHGQPLMLYCTDCQQVICFQCFETGHKDHQCQELSQAAAKMKSRMRKMEKFLKDSSPKYQGVLLDVQQKRTTFARESARARQNLDICLEETLRLLQQKQASLKEKFDYKTAETVAEMNALEERMRVEKVKAESLQSHVADIVTANTDDVSLLKKAPEVLNLMREIQKPPARTMSCGFNISRQDVSADMLEKMVGSITIENKTSGEPVPTTAAAAAERPGVDRLPDRLALVDTINVRASIIAMGAANGRLYMIQEGMSSNLIMYDVNRRTFHDLKLTGVKQPSTLTIVGDEFGVLVTEGQSTPGYNVTKGYFGQIGRQGDIINPTAVTLSGLVTGVGPYSLGNLLVTSVGPKQLTIYCVQGSRLNTGDVFDLPTDDFSDNIKAVESAEDFAVLDMDKRRITWVDKTGTPLHKYRLSPSPQRRHSSFTSTEPHECYITDYGKEFLLITDGVQGSVTVVNQDKSLVLDILGRNDGISNPRVTHWDSGRGELYVAQVDVQFRPPYGGASTPLISVYNLPALRGHSRRQHHQQQQQQADTPAREMTVHLTLPNLTDSNTNV